MILCLLLKLSCVCIFSNGTDIDSHEKKTTTRVKTLTDKKRFRWWCINPTDLWQFLSFFFGLPIWRNVYYLRPRLHSYRIRRIFTDFQLSKWNTPALRLRFLFRNHKKNPLGKFNFTLPINKTVHCSVFFVFPLLFRVFFLFALWLLRLKNNYNLNTLVSWINS